jgi:heat shock protein HslJ
MSARTPTARLLPAVLGSLVTLVVLAASGCAAGSPAAQPSASAGGPSASPGGEEACVVRSLVPFGCTSFQSVDGSDAAGPVAWLSTTPLTLTFSVLNQTPTLVVVTPCNTLNVPITISTDQLTPHADDVVSGAKGCTGPAGDQEAWARRLMSSPLSYSLDRDELRLQGSDQSVVLTRTDSSPR